MGIFPFFSKKNKQLVLVRCMYCSYEFHLLPTEVRLLEAKNARDPTCPIKEECDICHTGFMIPVHYTDKQGKIYRFHELKPKIKHLDLNTALNRIFNNLFH